MKLPQFVNIILILGHVIDGISELPLVVSDKIQEYAKTKQAVLFLRRNKLWGDVLKVSFFHLFSLALVPNGLVDSYPLNFDNNARQNYVNHRRYSRFCFSEIKLCVRDSHISKLIINLFKINLIHLLFVFIIGVSFKEIPCWTWQDAKSSSHSTSWTIDCIR
jgi:hypothetical protein